MPNTVKLVIVVLTAVAGTTTVWALTNTYHTQEVESATRTANAKVVADTSASGSSAIKFGTSSGGTCSGSTTWGIPAGPDPGWGCWPTPDTVGVPAGTQLTAYTGPMVVQTDGTIIDGKLVTGELRILANNVIIRNSRIEGMIRNDLNDPRNSFTIEDSTINVPSQAVRGLQEGNFTARRIVVVGGASGGQCSRNCTIEDSYIVGGFIDNTGVHHMSGFRMEVDGTFRRNVIGCLAPDIPPDAGCSAGLTGYGDFTTLHNNTLENNLFLPGGGYCAYGGSSGQGGGKPFPNAYDIRFISNYWVRGESGKCGFYGPVTSFDSAAPGNTWQNNRYYPDGANVPPSN